MKQTLRISSEEIRRRAVEIIKRLPFSTSKIYEVVIREYKRNRSLEANALYWQWLTIIGASLGELKEDLHERYKDMFLVNIYERDNEDYAEMVQALREVWKHGMKKEAIDLRKRIVALTSTTTATTKQMSEYMTAVDITPLAWEYHYRIQKINLIPPEKELSWLKPN